MKMTRKGSPLIGRGGPILREDLIVSRPGYTKSAESIGLEERRIG
jgi:hypothetical protein